MKVTVNFHEDTREDYDRWYAEISESEIAGSEFAKLYAESVLEFMRTSAGIIPQAIRIKSRRKPTYWWRFHEDWWMKYEIRDSSSFFIVPMRRIIVIRMVQSDAFPDDP